MNSNWIARNIASDMRNKDGAFKPQPRYAFGQRR